MKVPVLSISYVYSRPAPNHNLIFIMALQAEIMFQVFEGGKRIDAVRKSTMVNNFDEFRTKLIEQIKKAYPEIVDANIVISEKFESVGFWFIGATVNTVTPNRQFTLQISKI